MGNIVTETPRNKFYGQFVDNSQPILGRLQLIPATLCPRFGTET